MTARGALFHDIGKAETHEIEYGKFGAEMGLAMGLPEAITAVMEKHIRGGLSAEEAGVYGYVSGKKEGGSGIVLIRNYREKL